VLDEIHLADGKVAITKGLPRLVNKLVTSCLICAYGRKQKQIDEDVVYQASQELEV
jgi:type II secretory pathway predicted ATPase ExeA